MDSTNQGTREYVAFRGDERVAAGGLAEVAVALRERIDSGDPSLVLIFDKHDGRQIDVDLDGTVDEIKRRYAAPSEVATSATRGRGRPKLGVVGREVTLLPRHWEWLQTQRGGPSATLRRLVDEARRAGRDRDRVRQAQDAIHRFISATAGDLPGFEEATRCLYRGNRAGFEAEIAGWPSGVRNQVDSWIGAAFDDAAIDRRQESGLR
jgi:hypothetical protein